MKIALCISGITRQYKECFPSFEKNLLQLLQQNHELSVFIHGWHTIPEEYKTIQQLYNAKVCVLQELSLNKMQTVMDDVNVGYVSSLDHTIPQHALKNNMTGMFYNIYKCNELKKTYALTNNIQYDITIHTRFDNIYFEPLILNRINNIQPNTIYFEGCRSHICDHFYYGMTNVMDKVSEIYLQLHTLFQLPSHTIKGIGAEHLLHYCISKYGYTIQMPIKKNIQHCIYYMAVKHYKEKLNK
jgi:hypothetical protein